MNRHKEFGFNEQLDVDDQWLSKWLFIDKGLHIVLSKVYLPGVKTRAISARSSDS